MVLKLYYAHDVERGIKYRERSDLHNKYKKYKEDMGMCDICGLDDPMKDFDHTCEEEKNM